ncbi:MAG TPA: helix-turn-helix transcriptional regulator [Longimicrobiales bacterium]|jgi:DNA-binding PadR family transcriptional regulator|nr:helix-turn-helix transcriptional regulator [Longimicrobiales bacterium]
MTEPSGISERARAHLPVKPVVFHILLALAPNPSHGYGVIQAVRERSEGRVRLETGPFYRHLRKLLDGGLVEETDERPENDDPRRGAYYRLTALGREVVGAEGRRLAGLVSATAELGLLADEGTA